MIVDIFLNIESAKELKKIGFDLEVRKVYNEKSNYFVETSLVVRKSEYSQDFLIPIPTVHQAVDFLKDKYDIWFFTKKFRRQNTFKYRTFFQHQDAKEFLVLTEWYENPKLSLKETIEEVLKMKILKK